MYKTISSVVLINRLQDYTITDSLWSNGEILFLINFFLCKENQTKDGVLYNRNSIHFIEFKNLSTPFRK